MGNIMDYIEWRGDLPFTQSEFNDVDNLILACFSYVNLDGIQEAASQNGIELKALTEKFLQLHTEKELKEDKSFIRFAPFMMLEMAKTERFGQCVIRNYVNEIVAEEAQQFSAVEICLSDGTSYISFRGTDDTIVGWKEDFNLSTGVVPGAGEGSGIFKKDCRQFTGNGPRRRPLQRWKSCCLRCRDVQRDPSVDPSGLLK